MATFQRLNNTPKDAMVFYNETTSTLFSLSSNGLFRYNSDTDRWNEQSIINKLPDNFFRSVYDMIVPHPIAMDPATNTLYFLNQKKSLAILKIAENDENNKWIIKDRMSNKIADGVEGIVINNKYHLIGGIRYYQHLKYNEERQNIEVVHKMINNIKCIRYHRLVRIKNNVFMFGGVNGFDGKHFDTINQYNASKNEWITLPQKMPNALYSFGCTKILDEKYVVLLGGYIAYITDTEQYGGSDDIWIYSVYDGTFRKSNTKCPLKATFRYAFTINNRKRDEIITFGYVRDKWRECNINNHLFPPQYLIKIMHKYYHNEWIHLFGCFGQHWNIDVFDII